MHYLESPKVTIHQTSSKSVHRGPRQGSLNFYKKINFFGATLKQSFYFSLCPPFAVRPSVRPKKIILTLPLCPTSAVRPGANPIQWGQSYAHFCKNLYRIGPRSDVGQGHCQEKFFMVGRSVSRRGVGWRMDGSYYFSLEPPIFSLVFFVVVYSARVYYSFTHEKSCIVTSVPCST